MLRWRPPGCAAHRATVPHDWLGHRLAAVMIAHNANRVPCAMAVDTIRGRCNARAALGVAAGARSGRSLGSEAK